MSEMLKPSEVAERLGLSIKTVNRMLSNGILPWVNLSATGNVTRPRRRVTQEALDNFIESQSKK